ncbi:DM13 domain-containing protein [Synechococcus sp. CCY 9618]|uniref:DM13 domain-containing protein n=1 Tax=Synechococcus sp. CCY 9618 TaxID=2815602 RepID=UPI0020B4401B|nr:DM13 domain-containing protein [Synechococcus sp. CCY 9618]
MTPLTGSLLRRSIYTVVTAAALSTMALNAEPRTGGMGDKAGSAMTAQMKPKGMAMTQGSFRKAEAPVSGGFSIHEEGGKKVLTLSGDFMTNDMAPDLKVAFSPSATPLAMSKAPKYPLKAGSYTVLAKLKSSKGAQSYVIPASIDLKAQKSVLIWCQKFNATMAWAPLKS